MQKIKNIFVIFIISILTIFLIIGIVSCNNSDKIAELNGDWNLIVIDDIKINPEDFSNKLP